jgi:hypothetical protein
LEIRQGVFPTLTLGILDSSQAVIRRLAPGINKTFDSLNLIVGEEIDNSPSSIDTARLSTEGVNPNMALLITDFRNISGLIDIAVNDAESTSITYSELENTIASLSANVSSIISTVRGWADPGVTIVDGLYRTNYTPTAISFTSLQATFDTIPNGKDQMAPIKEIELSRTISDYTATSSGLPARITSFVRLANAPTKRNLADAVAVAKSTIMDSISSLESVTDRTFDGGRTQLNSFLSTVETYNSYRSTATIVLSSSIFAIMLIIGFGFAKQKPIIAKGCNLCASPLYLLIQLLAIITFILAVVFGDICSSVFEYTPAPILKGIDSSFGAPIVQLTTLRDECSNNISIIQVAVDVKLVQSESVNITLQLDNTIGAVNLTEIAIFNLEPLVWLNDTPSNLVNRLTILDLSLLASSSVDPKITSANSYLSSISNALNLVSAEVNSLKTDRTRFVYNPENVNKTLAHTNYDARATAMISTIASVVTDISNLQNKLNNYQTALTVSLFNNATSAKSAASSWGTLANSKYDSVRSSMRNFSTYAQGAIGAYPSVMRARIFSSMYFSNKGTFQTEKGLRENTTCLDLGTAVFVLQDAVCGQFEGDLIS